MREDAKRLIEEVREKVLSLKDHYVGPDSFMHLFAIIAGWFAEAHAAVERKFSQETENLKWRLLHAVEKFKDESAKTYLAAHNAAHARLAAAIREAHRADVEHRQQIPDLKNRQKELKIRMAGHENAAIKLPKNDKWSKVAWWLFYAAAALGAMGIEYQTGFGIWKVASDPDLANGLSLITIVGFTVLAFVAAHNLSKMHAHSDAERNFKRTYPDKKGLGVDPLPRYVRIAGWTGTILFLVLGAAVLYYRMVIVNDTGYDRMAIAGSFALLAFLFVMGLVEYLFAKPYSDEHYDELRAIQAELNTTGKVYRRETEAAIKAYQLEMETALKAAQKQLNGLEADRIRLVDLLQERVAVLAMFKQGFLDSCRDLAQAIGATKNVDRAQVPFGNREADERIVALFTNRITVDNDTALLDTMRKHRFSSIDLPEIELREFKSLEREIQASISMPGISNPDSSQKETV